MFSKKLSFEEIQCFTTCYNISPCLLLDLLRIRTKASDDFLKHLATASYVAIDEEMTGISIPGEKRAPKDDTPEQRYQRLKAVPERYSIISVGVSLFHKNPNFQEPQQRLQEGEELDVNNGNEDEEITSEPEYIAVSIWKFLFPSLPWFVTDLHLFFFIRPCHVFSAMCIRGLTTFTPSHHRRDSQEI